MGDLTEGVAEEQLYAERERYRTLIDQIEIGIFHTDADDRLLFVNDEYLRTMGCSAAELQGIGWHSRVHPEDRERVTRGAMSAGYAHRNWSDEYRVLAAHGAVRWVRASARPLHDQDGVFTGYLGTCLDITELREAEEDRRRAAVAQAARGVSEAAAARLQGLVTGLSAIVWERDARSGDYTFITDRVVDVLGYSINAWIGRSDFWTFILHPADREEAVAAAAAATAAGQDWEQTYRAVGADGRTVWLHDLVHVVRDGTGAAASVLGVSIDVTTQKRQDEAMALLAEFGSRQDADQPLAERLGALVRAATPLLGELSAVVLVGPDNLLRPFVAAAPMHPDALTTLLGFAPLPVPPSLAERIAAGRAFVLPGTADEILSEVVADEDELRARLAVGARDWLVVPLTAAGRLLGLLAFACFARPRAYDRLDMTLAEEFGHRIALMIRTDEAAGRERHLRDVSAALASADTPAAVGQVLRTGLAHAFGASGLTIHALGPHPNLLRLVTAAGYPAGVTPRFRIVRLSDRSPIAECARTGESVWVGDTGGWPTWQEEQVDGDEAVVARAVLALPLRTGGRLVGVVAAGFPTRRAFSTDERDSIAAMISQAAQAFHRAVDAEQRRDIAETLQHSLLPADPPHLERLALATQYLPGVSGVAAGGDWFDVITLDENRTAIVVGDVVGQGAAAAALMGQLRSALSSGLLLVESPAAALAHLNRFTARIPGARASTAVCLVIDTAAGQARWARAGHPPPLLVPREGPARHVEGGAGPLLGVFSVDGPIAGLFTEGVLAITPGDTLILYTDGLVERRGESIDDGMDRLTAAASSLTAADPPRLVAGLLAATVPAGRGHDDIAVVAARFLPPPLHMRCPAAPGELSGVRRAARRWMTAHGVTGTVSDDLQLALGESAANAVEHAYGSGEPGEFEFTLSRHVEGRAIDVAVTDFGRWRPPPVDPGFRGRGLDLVRALAQSVSVEYGPAGTTVRFTMTLPKV